MVWYSNFTGEQTVVAVYVIDLYTHLCRHKRKVFALRSWLLPIVVTMAHYSPTLADR